MRNRRNTGVRVKRLLSAIAAITIMVSSAASGYAIYAYGQNEQEVMNEFINQYGWDRSKMGAFEWTGADGQSYTRQSSYEKSFYDDVYTTNEELAITLGLITAVPETSGNAGSMVALALAEWKAGVCETPLGSNNVKYNTWYYGHTVSGESYPWCCAFISWLADQCGLLDCGVYTKTAGCAQMRSYFISKGYTYWGIRQSTPFGGTETPIPGDIIIWGNTSHIGLIVAVNGDSIETVEGNAGDRVSHHTYTSASLSGDFGISEVFRIEYPDNETAIFNFLVSKMGLPVAGACGVVANIACESGFNEQALGDGGTSFGICQWHNERYTMLRNKCAEKGLDYRTLDGQLYYLQWELETYYPSLLSRLRTVPNSGQGAYDAGFAWCHDFEVCVGYEFSASNLRGNSARSTYWPKYA